MGNETARWTSLRRFVFERIWLLLKALLAEKKNVRKIRFWGKIFGTEKNYYVAEVDLDAFDDVETDDAEFHKYQEACAVEDADTMEMNFNRKVPPEGIGEGINQKLFYVSTGSKSFLSDAQSD